MKFLVTADLDWIQGRLRYGHLEGIVEVESEEELEEMINSEAINDYLDLIVDDYSVDYYEEPDRYEWSEVHD